jgi:hypothetical protein
VAAGDLRFWWCCNFRNVPEVKIIILSIIIVQLMFELCFKSKQCISSSLEYILKLHYPPEFHIAGCYCIKNIVSGSRGIELIKV